jgi:outer membrane murein-binding lipoprotein Lpp
VPRAIRERPRYALLLGLGLACLVALGVLAGLLLAGGDDSTSQQGPSAEARELRATRADLEDAQAELDTLQADVENAGAAAARQRARAAAWRQRAQRLQRRNQALQRALRQARQEE